MRLLDQPFVLPAVLVLVVVIPVAVAIALKAVIHELTPPPQAIIRAAASESGGALYPAEAAKAPRRGDGGAVLLKAKAPLL